MLQGMLLCTLYKKSSRASPGAVLGSLVTEFCLRPAPGAGVTNLPAAVLKRSQNSSASLGIPALGVSLRSWLLQ